MSKFWLMGAGALLGVLVIVSIVIALVEKEAVLEAGTAEARVQEFLRTFEDEDYASAHAMMSDTLQAECPIEDFVARDRFQRNQLRDSRITLQDTQVFDGTTNVNVSITSFYANEPFGTSESSYVQTYQLRQDAEGEWRFINQYPYPVFNCPYFGNDLREPDFPKPEPTPTATPEPAS